jgi:hypothetical protein
MDKPEQPTSSHEAAWSRSERNERGWVRLCPGLCQARGVNL